MGALVEILKDRPVLILHLYGFASHFNPSKAFLTPYLTLQKGIEAKVVDNSIYPVWTFSMLFCVVAYGVLYFFYGRTALKPLVVGGAIGRTVTSLLVLVSNDVGVLQLSEAFSGLGRASNVIFFTYIYFVCQADRFQVLTGTLQATALVGEVCSALLGQALIGANVDWDIVFWLAFAFSIVALGLSFAFTPIANVEEPPAKAPSTKNRSISTASDDGAELANRSMSTASDRKKSGLTAEELKSRRASVATGVLSPQGRDRFYINSQTVLNDLWSLNVDPKDKLMDIYSAGLPVLQPKLWFWAFWIWLGRAVANLVEKFQWSLFRDLDSSSNNNGYLMAVARLMATAGSLFAGSWKRLHLTSDHWNTELIMMFTMFLMVVVMVLLALSVNLIMAYATVVSFELLQNFVNNTGKASQAHIVSRDKNVMLFASNTFFQYIVQTVIQSALTSVSITSSTTFFVLAGMLLALLVLWTVWWFQHKHITTNMEFGTTF